MRFFYLLPACLILTLFTGSTPAAEKETDWPRFRGPGQNNLAPDTGLLKEWPQQGPPVVWKATGLGSGYSSVTVASNRVYTMGNHSRLSYVVAIDRDKGKFVWAAAVGPAGGNLGCTPTVDGDRVYAIGQSGDLVCVNAADGEVHWRKSLTRDFGGHCGGWQYTESPLIDGAKVVCTPGAADATMVALN